MTEHHFGGPWTELKLDAVCYYLECYTKALSQKRFDLWYIDAFAGTGDRTNQKLAGGLLERQPVRWVTETLPGSAKRAMNIRPPFQHFIFNESDGDHRKALIAIKDTNKSLDIEILDGDANVQELHEAAMAKGLFPLLEISSKSDLEVGQKLSAFHLKIIVEGKSTTVESAFQGSKVFEFGGPFTEILHKSSRDAKRDSRIRESGRLVRFELEGKPYPTSPMTLFYDWLYFRALFPHRDWISRRNEWAGFTDIEFNPERSINCQARSFAAFIALLKRGCLEKIMSSFEAFREQMETASI